jgi:hypothetical protein
MCMATDMELLCGKALRHISFASMSTNTFGMLVLCEVGTSNQTNLDFAFIF